MCSAAEGLRRSNSFVWKIEAGERRVDVLEIWLAVLKSIHQLSHAESARNDPTRRFKSGARFVNGLLSMAA